MQIVVITTIRLSIFMAKTERQRVYNNQKNIQQKGKEIYIDAEIFVR